LRGLLADDATFTGPLGHSENADDYREAIGRMFAITTGIVIRKMIAELFIPGRAGQIRLRVLARSGFLRFGPVNN
jgi:hypothetical protein